MKNNLCRNNRHPTKRKRIFPTDTHSLISCGKREQQILRYVKKTKGRLNIKACAKATNIPRTSIYDILNRLQTKNLVSRSLADAKITTEGLNYLQSIEGGVETFREGCRDTRRNLSTHHVSYKFEIKTKAVDWLSKIESLNYKDYKLNKIPNLEQHIFYFDDATIIITKYKVLIKIREVVGEDVEDNAFKSFSLAINYVDRLSSIGVKGQGLYLEEAHYARVNSVFAEILEKCAGKYSVTLSDGSKFWIDHSPPNDREDETDNAKLRSRIDGFVKDLEDSESLFSDVDELSEDIDKMKYVVAGLLRIEMTRFDFQKNKDLGNFERPNYMG